MASPTEKRFQPGGALKTGSFYIERPADREIVSTLAGSEFCYVLAPRQIGKSSLRVRATIQLREQGIACVVIDLTAIGENRDLAESGGKLQAADQWYFSIAQEIQLQLPAAGDPLPFWKKHQNATPAQRFRQYLLQEVLAQTTQPVVIFVDEIDYVLSLPFSTDEFFALIRAFYNGRADDANLGRLTFCLIGVATPGELIHDPTRTPFNIGHEIRLGDFTAGDIETLAKSLAHLPQGGQALAEEIFAWTSGHPYMMQRIAGNVASSAQPAKEGVSAAVLVADIVKQAFLVHGRARDANLEYAERRLSSRPAALRLRILQLYRRLLTGQSIPAEHEDAVQLALLLTGLGADREVGGRRVLQLRNRIFAQVFDADWTTAAIALATPPRLRTRSALLGAAATLVVGAAAGGVLFWDYNYGEHIKYYAHYNERFGVPVGVGPIAGDGWKHRRYSYRFYLRKWGSRLARWERVNGSGVLSEVSRGDASAEYSYDEKTGRLHEVVNRDGSGQTTQRLAYSQDLQRAERHDQYDQIKPEPGTDVTTYRFEYDQDGYEIKQTFASAYGSPRANRQRVFGYQEDLGEHKLTRRRRAIDASGTPMVSEQGYAIAEYERDASGNVVRTAYFTEKGEPTLCNEGYHEVRTSYDLVGNDRESWYLDIDGKPVLSTSGYAKDRQRHDARGNVILREFFGTDGRLITITDGFAAWSAKYNDQGRQVEKRYLGPDGQPTNNMQGYAGSAMRYDSVGHLTGLDYLNAAGKVTAGKAGVAGWRAVYDTHGRQTRYTFVGIDNADVNHSLLGWAKRERIYDERGREIQCSFYGSNGQPILKKSRFSELSEDELHNQEDDPVFERGLDISSTNGIAAWTASYDERGRQLERRFLGKDRAPTLNDKGVAIWDFHYDQQGNRDRVLFRGLDDKPTLDNTGIAGWQSVYDGFGHRTEQTFLGINGAPTASSRGITSQRWRHDNLGRETKLEYSGRDGRPIQDLVGTSGWEATYDSKGRLESRIYLGLGGLPCWHCLGVAGTRNEYDSRGNIITFTYLGEGRKPMRDITGIVGFRRQFDAPGHEIKRSYFDESGLPTLHPEGYASYITKFSDKGQEIERRYLDLAGIPTPLKAGYAIRRYEFDDKGNWIKTSYYDARDQLTPFTNGQAVSKYTLDSHGNRIAEEFFGPNGGRTYVKAGYSIIQRTYDDRDEQRAESYFDAEGRPSLHRDGYASQQRDVDRYGHEIAVTYYGTDGKPVSGTLGYAKKAIERDAYGRAIAEAYFDQEMKPTLDKAAGIHCERTTYNALGRKVRTDYLGIANQPILHKDGIASIEYGTDNRGHNVERKYFGINSELILNKDGVARIVFRPDDQGHPSASQYFGIHDQLVLNKAGYAATRNEYDQLGRLLREAYLGLDGKPLLNKEGHAAIAYSYDQYGHKTAQTYLGLDGRPIKGKENWATLRKKYNPLGSEEEVAYLDPADRLTVSVDGIALTRYRYDERQNLVETSYYGLDGKPATHRKEGFANKQSAYDERRNLLSERYFDGLGHPVPNHAGYAVLSNQYDRQSRLIHRRYLDVADKPAANKEDGSYGLFEFTDPDTRERYQVGYDALGKCVFVSGEEGDLSWRFKNGTVTIKSTDPKKASDPASKAVLAHRGALYRERFLKGPPRLP